MTRLDAVRLDAVRLDAVRVDAAWTGDGFRTPATFEVRGDLLTPTARTDLRPHHIGGTLFPRLTDHHVHLGLIDPAALLAGGITHAHDLGWIPSVATGWLAAEAPGPTTTIAGALLTAPGGYPARSTWAPPGAAREVGGPRDGREAVREQVMAGASRIKVALNSAAGETVDDATLRAIVDEAVTAGLPVIVHAQGPGQPARAITAGATHLAHTPFDERVDDAVLAEMADRGATWISTLDIHGWGHPTAQHAIAIDNLRRFHAAGGRVLYGTDLGNGPLAVGVNAREIADLLTAGLTAVETLRSIAGDGSAAHLAPNASIGPRFAWTPAPPPADPADLAAWIATARPRAVADLPAPASPDTTDTDTTDSTTRTTISTEGPHR
ncbi:hypothetical protein LLS1_05910 [Leifsonia sp. LS1]|uniref:amidohydrolase family protein n=1 Tax=Leifsonia sp. LS1 TaxID=2828483 RepID=UPI001CFE8B5E|nr:amidohydrolase family protein [Leifsonia sp. LS1]GIT78922.1 hypothetical protein LLS1_05910 [Leifsonia sp. LS1]